MSDQAAMEKLALCPSPIDVLENPSTSYWLKSALSAALCRDPVDAAADAELLNNLLKQHAASVSAKALIASKQRRVLTGTPLRFPQ